MQHFPLSQYEGQISRLMVLDYMNQMVKFDEIIERYSGLLEAFDHPIELTILANTRLDIASKMAGSNIFPFLDRKFPVGMHTVTFQSPLSYTEFLRPALRKLFGSKNIAMSDGNFFSAVPWAQDPFSVLTDGQGGTVLLDPWYNDLYFDYQLVGRAMAAQTDAVLKPTPLYLEGGNVLQARDFILVGQDIVQKNMERYGMDQARVEIELKKAFGVEKMWVLGTDEKYGRSPYTFQGKYQPLFHLDMYVTLGGKIATEAGDKELVFVGELAVVGESDDADFKTHLARVARDLDRTAEKLHAIGFEVERLPLPLWVTDHPRSGKRKTQYLSMNNALVEVTVGARTIYLPAYVAEGEREAELAALRRQGRHVLESRGFVVKRVEGPYSDFSRIGGALHCISKVLARH